MLFKKEFECRCELNKSIGSFCPIENTSEDLNRKERKNRRIVTILVSNLDYLFNVKDIRNIIHYQIVNFVGYFDK